MRWFGDMVIWCLDSTLAYSRLCCASLARHFSRLGIINASIASALAVLSCAPLRYAHIAHVRHSPNKFGLCPHLLAMFHVKHFSFLNSQLSTLYRFTDYSGFAFMILLTLGIINKFVLLSLTRKIHRFIGAQRLIYLPIITSKMFTSLGETPGIRLACAMVSGSVLISFWRASVDIAVMEA